MHNTHHVVKTEEVVGVDVKNTKKEDLGKIEEVMLDKLSGRAVYLVLSFGGILGMGEKYFAIPWNAIHYDKSEDCFILDRDKESLKKAPGFDKDHWPDMADKQWGTIIYEYYGTKPHWQA